MDKSCELQHKSTLQHLHGKVEKGLPVGVGQR